MGTRNRELLSRLCLNALFGLVWLFAGCSVTTKLTSPLPVKNFGTMSDEAIGLYVSGESKKYVWKGNINVSPYTVEFGNALEANAKHALSKAFRKVTVIDHFPPPLSAGGEFSRAVSVEIDDANVSPGALTFSSTSAEVRLKAVIAERDQMANKPILVRGSAEASPGILGANPIQLFGIFGTNQAAYDAALQEASEKAMTSALEQLVDTVIKDRRPTP